MNDTRHIPVFGREGQLGWVEPRESASSADHMLVRLADGTTVEVSTDLLIQQANGSFYLPMSQSQFEANPDDQQAHRLVIPVVVEEAQVSKKRTTRTVRIHKDVTEREELVDEPGFHEEVNVERVPVNREVDMPPEVRYEGDTIIIPVLEEVLVVEKRLVLKEEVRVSRKRETTHNPQRVTLRSENVAIDRLEPEDEAEVRDIPSKEPQNKQKGDVIE